MESPSVIALSRQLALRREMDLVANNVANANTPSYKGEKMMFVEYLVRPQKNAPMSFVQDIGTARDLSEGPLTKTDNRLDIAITGDGYFTVQTDTGARYSRSGRFQLNADGQIANQQGHPVLTVGGQPITIPPGTTTISVAPDGTVSADTEAIGTIAVVTFDKPQSMKREASNLFATGETPTPAENATILQGMLEEANVNSVIEMTRMIQIHRAYASNQRLMQNEHDRVRQSIRRLVAPPRR